MLVLSQTPGERILITCPDGTEIVIKTIDTGHRVRLGFEAPLSVGIVRERVLESCVDLRTLSAPALEPIPTA